MGKGGKCEHQDCKITATFNEEGKKPAFCKLHAEDSMVDVVSKRCKHPGGCTTQPHYHHPGSKTAVFCRQHAEDSMVDVVSKRCKHSGGCTTQPHYNHPGSKTAVFCKKHAEDGMVDIKNETLFCKHPSGCTTRQSLGYWADGIASRCAKHQADLDDEAGLVITYNQRCKVAGVKGCGGVVNWGPEGEQPTHCHKHGAPKAADGFVRIPKKSHRGAKGAASRPRRGGAGGTAKKARKALPRRADTSSEESASDSESDSDEEYDGEDDSEPEPEPVKKKRIIWL